MNGNANDAYDDSDFPDIKLSPLRTEEYRESAFPTIEERAKGHPHNNGLAEMTEPPKKTFKHKQLIIRALQFLAHVLVGSYFGYATYHQVYIVQNRSHTGENNYPNDDRCYVDCAMQFCSGYGMLVLLVGFIYFGLFYYFVFKPTVGLKLHKKAIKPFGKWWFRFSRTRLISGVLLAIVLCALAVFIYFETKDELQKLNGITAPIVFIILGYIFSTSRKNIKWRIVITGITSQFILGIICIRWDVGRSIFECLGEKVRVFLNFSEDGSRFVFGDDLVDKSVFAFAILPVIFFFSFFISVLYYLGTMQWVVLKMGYVLQQLLGTTICESVISAANIFLGMSESPLLVRPYIKVLTASEIHSIMASGFATVSGTVLAAYMSFGASPAHLITSSVMAAPAALAMSKLYLPETEESKTTAKNMTLEKSEDTSILDAASNGATLAIPIILGITANIVAFVAFVSFLNAIVNWLGYLVGLYDVDFEWLFSKIFIPLAWGMGVPWDDCDIIAKVVATKTIINEFVAYERLGEYLSKGQIEARSAGIATFAICGFANPSSLGILIGSLGAIAPMKRQVIISVAIRAFIVGSIVCFTSASFAGLLIQKEEVEDTYQRFFESKMYARNHTMIAGVLPL